MTEGATPQPESSNNAYCKLNEVLKIVPESFYGAKENWKNFLIIVTLHLN